MQTVTVSPKFQVVIPREVREFLHLRPGQKMQVEAYEGRIELIPDREIAELRGFIRGINTDFVRDRAGALILGPACLALQLVGGGRRARN